MEPVEWILFPLQSTHCPCASGISGLATRLILLIRSFGVLVPVFLLFSGVSMEDVCMAVLGKVGAISLSAEYTIVFKVTSNAACQAESS